MKKLTITLLITCNVILNNPVYAGNGGNVAAGVIGGLAGGAILGAAISKPRTREVVYVENERPSRSSRKERELRQWENDLRQQECELRDWEQDLQAKEHELNRRESSLSKREHAFKKRNQPLLRQGFEKQTTKKEKEVTG